VNQGILGNFENVESKSKFIIGNHGKLNLFALDSISIYSGCIITETGELNLHCYGKTELSSCKIESGANVKIISNSTTLNNGFTIEKGASIEIKGDDTNNSSN
ncbi:MAG: hypothetical protein K2L89_01855, partial [Muribaculaceae bacterium]|nr:hypothetical protein [Muribaculaceae bacterium]